MILPLTRRKDKTHKCNRTQYVLFASTHVPHTQCVTWKVVKPKFFGAHTTTHTRSTHKNNPLSFDIGVRVNQPPQPQEKRTSAPRTADFQFLNAVKQVCEVKVNETTNHFVTSYAVVSDIFGKFCVYFWFGDGDFIQTNH